MTMGPYAYAASHIPGSISFDDPERGFASLGLDDTIIVYCSDPACIASKAAYQQFVDRGYRNVRRYSGGLSDWAAAGLPLEGTGHL
jgi:rhodanese-related sulfurtransferase